MEAPDRRVREAEGLREQRLGLQRGVRSWNQGDAGRLTGLTRACAIALNPLDEGGAVSGGPTVNCARANPPE